MEGGQRVLEGLRRAESGYWGGLEYSWWSAGGGAGLGLGLGLDISSRADSSTRFSVTFDRGWNRTWSLHMHRPRLRPLGYGHRLRASATGIEEKNSAPHASYSWPSEAYELDSYVFSTSIRPDAVRYGTVPKALCPRFEFSRATPESYVLLRMQTKTHFS